MEKLVNNISDENIIDNDMIKIDQKNKKIKYINKYLYIFIKRLFDIIAGIVGVIILIPLTIIIYIIRKILKENDGPIFYEQLRIGKDGKYFRLFKYRTMVVGAEKVLEEYLQKNSKAKKEYEESHKLKDDPRVTKIGKILRQTSLDEMPQLLNVLRGDMSIIGPRPYLPNEKDDMGTYYDKIIKCKPGITGLWQVSGRSKTSFKQRLKIESTYIDSMSLKTDIKILIKTIGTVLKKDGAV